MSKRENELMAHSSLEIRGMNNDVPNRKIPIYLYSYAPQKKEDGFIIYDE